MFSDDEINNVLAKILRESISKGYGTANVRDVGAYFTDLKSAASEVFLLIPTAPFYVIYLSAKLLAEQVQLVRTAISDLSKVVVSTGRYTLPVDNLSFLANARVAVESLATATENRSTPFVSQLDTAAFSRFEQNTSAFLAKYAGNVFSGGAVVKTPSSARSSIPTLTADLVSSTAALAAWVGAISGAVDDFNGIGLPHLATSAILRRTADLIGDRYAELALLTPEQRLELLRDTVLDVMAGRVAVANFGSLPSPTLFEPLSGVGGVFASEDYPATPASLVSDNYGPYPILVAPSGGNELDVTVDGVTSLVITLPSSFAATINSTIGGPYDIGEPNTAAVNNARLSIGLRNWPSVGGESVVDVVFSTGTAKLVDEVATEINDAILLQFPSMPLIAEPYVTPLRYAGQLSISYSSVLGTDADITPGPGAEDFVALNFSDGDYLIVVDPASSNNKAIYRIDVNGVTQSMLGVTQVSPLPPGVDETNITFNAGGQTVPLRLRITTEDDDPLREYRVQAVVDKVSIFFPEETPDPIFNDGKTAQYNGTTTFGLFPLMEVGSLPTQVSDIVASINTSSSVAPTGVPILSASSVFGATLFSGTIRTTPTNFLQVALYKLRGVADVTALGGSSARYTFATALSNILVGDILVVRESSQSELVNEFGSISAVGGTWVEVTLGQTPITESGRLVEIGPLLDPTEILDTTLVISGGSLNDGSYSVRGFGDTTIDLVLDRPVNFPTGAGGLPIFHTAALGKYRLVLSSLDTTLATKVSVALNGNANSALLALFTAATDAVGTTRYFSVPQVTRGLGVGDALELYTTSVTNPTTAATITSVDRDLKTIQVDAELPTDTPTYIFSTTGQLPFARVRNSKSDGFNYLKETLEAFLSGASMAPNYFLDLQRYLNSVVGTTNPTPASIASVVSHLTLLYESLGTVLDALSGYTVTVVPEIDFLLRAYREKGADKAVDALLHCRFSEFFAMDFEDASYLSAAQKALRAVNKEDLPVKKDSKARKVQQVILASYEDKDFEFDFSDIDPPE